MPDPVDQVLNRTIFPKGKSLIQEDFIFPEGLNSQQSVSIILLSLS